ncbi:unnamed protein product [Prorocentrum cordatum]|uniref:NAD-dependent epimerase/dehydratase domain-containing protein n=1 Tax=Prorocentrum cordatum TaxID=2364126 RepID=A0ABN9W428_9DINO|nr:unnamed protein product [Polarella glacialis]
MGAPTARLLQERGHRVVVLARGSARGGGAGGARPEQARGCEMLACDRGHSASFVEALSGEGRPRVVVDFTAMLPRHFWPAQWGPSILMCQPTPALIGRTSLVHQEGIETGRFSRGGPWEAIFVRHFASVTDKHCFDTGLGVRNCFGDAVLKHIADVVEVHRRRPLEHYIFISTNMVYPGGVEDMDITSLPQPVAEGAANLSAAHAAPDTYGGRKLKCEAALQRARAEQGLRWTVLRPPAVVGPGCDSRHERLQRLVAGLPPLPARASKRPPTVRPGRFRVAYSGDVAEAVAAVVELGERVHGEAFNIACPASMTLGEYVGGIASCLGLCTQEVPDDPALRNYERQGEVDVSKSLRVLGIEGTPVQRWMRQTVSWHARALAEAPASWSKIISRARDTLV